MSTASDFVIENGVLKKYVGPGGDVIITDGVVSIGEYAFYGCESLKSIVIPEGITSIEDYAFYRCELLASIVIPNGVASIGIYAFSGCKSLTSIVIPNGVTSIGVAAFSGCRSLTSIIIPNGVTSIGGSAFSECESLKSIVIPDGVTSIGNYAFYGCGLTSIAIPDGVTSIGERAFYRCENLTNIAIPNSVTSIEYGAFYGCENLKSVVIPDGVTSIGGDVFSGCESLTSIVIPNGVTSIGWGAFSGCKKLESIEIPNSVVNIKEWAFSGCKKLKEIRGLSPACKMGKDVFGDELPKGLIGAVGELWACFTDTSLKEYVLDKKVWTSLAPEQKADIYLTRQGKPLQTAYKAVIKETDTSIIGEALLMRLSGKHGTKDYATAENFMTAFFASTPADLLKMLYAKLKELKAAEKALKTIEAHIPLMEKLSGEVHLDESLPQAEQRILSALAKRGQSTADLEKIFKEYYGLTFSELPSLLDTEGATLTPSVLAYLCTLHETMVKSSWGGIQPDVAAAYKTTGLCPEAQELVALIDGASLQRVLLALADKNLGLSGRSKKMFLAYPICRYADESTMMELTMRAPKWRSSVSGNDAPPLATFRKANIYSNTRAAMLFADRYHELEMYAKVRGTTADNIRDQFLSDIGINENGCKDYDLGNQVVTARLQKDLTFVIELPDGKSAKSLPKKGADEAKYKAANADFSEMKKNAKRIIKNRTAILFEDFLSGGQKSAEVWRNAYLANPVLRAVAKLLVWDQKGNTFTLTDDNIIRSDGSVYVINNKPIKLAHPMEMKPEDVAAWQKYFASHAHKQPFEQIWEPVIDPQSIAKERYAGCMIPYYRFTGQAKRGITVEDYDFHNEIYISFKGCTADIERIDWRRHEINMDDRFEIKAFSFERFDRQINHIVAYLDRITVFGRILNDDVSVVEMMPMFTLAQIMEFVNTAAENSCTNVLAVLMDYKNRTFANFDSLEEFTLDL